MSETLSAGDILFVGLIELEPALKDAARKILADHRKATAKLAEDCARDKAQFAEFRRLTSALSNERKPE